MTREQKLELIWSPTHDDFRGIAGAVNFDAWPFGYRGKRTILSYEPGVGTVLKLLDHLPEDEIAADRAILQREQAPTPIHACCSSTHSH